jgi:predicted glycosyltransferase
MVPGPMKSPRVLFYVQHLLGIGHLIRASRIARALAESGFEVTMISGGPPIAGFPGRGISLVAMPPLKARTGFAGLVDMAGNPVDAAMETLRRGLLISVLRETAPQIVIIEAFPFGRRQMRFELLPLIEAAQAMRPQPLIACSVRDILQENRKSGRMEETADLVDKFFDLVLVHGDPTFVKFEETFPLAHSISSKLVYTGLVAGPLPRPPSEHFDVVASAGGGAAGLDLVRCTAEVAGKLSEGLRWCLLTGPNLPPKELQRLTVNAPPNLQIFSFRSDFADLLCAARLSISQAGYNTVCDILQADCRALLIPFAAGGESEQTIRAKRLEALGLAEVLSEQELSADRLREAAMLGLKASRPAAHGLNLRGTEGTTEILRQRLTKY